VPVAVAAAAAVVVAEAAAVAAAVEAVQAWRAAGNGPPDASDPAGAARTPEPGRHCAVGCMAAAAAAAAAAACDDEPDSVGLAAPVSCNCAAREGLLAISIAASACFSCSSARWRSAWRFSVLCQRFFTALSVLVSQTAQGKARLKLMNCPPGSPAHFRCSSLQQHMCASKNYTNG